MDSNSRLYREDEQMKLPPGFRFHPTDEELITHYLAEKVMDNNFNTVAMGEADLNKIEPWDLPRHAKMGEKEWYFFVVRDRKYPTGLRTNRATEAGYWKATGKDKEIYREKALVGMKKTLVFYTGRAPKGEKSNWVMHEYRLEGKYSKYNLSKNTKNDWVISRIYNKSSNAKKSDVSEMTSVNELHTSFLPPLMDSSPYNCDTKSVMTTPFHVAWFSNASMLEDQPQANKQEQTSMFGTSTSMTLTSSCSKTSLSNMLSEQNIQDFQYADSCFLRDQSMLKLLLEGKGTNSYSSEIPTVNTFSGLSNQEIVSNLTGPVDHESIWDY